MQGCDFRGTHGHSEPKVSELDHNSSEMRPFVKRPSLGPDNHGRQTKKPRYDEGSTSIAFNKETLPKLPPIGPHYAKAVFTHSSIAVQDPDDPEMVNYERLEFLGDAQLEHMASLVIFARYTSAAPGKMSTLREALVRNEVLCEFSRAYGFDTSLKMTESARASKERVKIDADCFEAYVAAVILSNTNAHDGFDQALKWMTELWEPKLKSLGMLKVDVKSKERLAQRVLAKGIKLQYQEERARIISKSAGTQTFFMGVYLDGWGYENQHLGSGEGSSKKEAEQDAAAAALANAGLMNDITAKRTQHLKERKSEDVTESHSRDQEPG